MKRKDLIKKITAAGCLLVRHGKKHDLYQNSYTGKKQPVPRHKEIDEHLAKHIIKELVK
jgi:predicted RNA binding protein YcfA (HicA-like mRNA interferase family)